MTREFTIENEYDVHLYFYLLCCAEFKRPRSLLVFVNPISGKKRGMKIYHSKVAPLFELAGISTTVICTERQNHAHDMLLSCDLEKFDG